MRFELIGTATLVTYTCLLVTWRGVRGARADVVAMANAAMRSARNRAILIVTMRADRLFNPQLFGNFEAEEGGDLWVINW